MKQFIPRLFFSLGLGLLSGVLMGITPAPVSAWPLAWLAIVPLWLWLRFSLAPQASTSKNWLIFALGWGMGYHGLALFWITHLHPLTWLGIPWLTSLAIATGCWFFITFWGTGIVMIWAAIVRWLWRSLEPCQGIPEGMVAGTLTNKPLVLSRISHRAIVASLLRVLFGVAVWCGLEALWSMGPLYWTSLSYTQSPHNLVILHLGRLSGASTVTAAIVTVNGLIAEALWTWPRFRRLGFSRDRTSTHPPSYPPTPPQSTKLLLTALAVLISAHLLGWGIWQSAAADSPDRALRVGIVQGNIPNEVKLDAQGLRLAQQRYTAGYEQLVNQGVDVVLTPEGAIPFVWGDVLKRSPIYRAIADYQVPLWLGTFMPVPYSNPAPLPSHITQSLITLTGTEADPLSRYNKIKLVPLGEYLPFESVLGSVINRLTSLDFSMVPGDTEQIFDTPFGRAAVGICYESAFGDWFRIQVARGAEFILTASNNDPYPRSMMMQHHAQDVMRSIENDRWAARATNTGLSAVVNAHGQTLWMAEHNAYQVHAATIYQRQTRPPYVRWGDWLMPLLLIGSGATYFAIQWLHRQQSREL